MEIKLLSLFPDNPQQEVAAPKRKATTLNMKGVTDSLVTQVVLIGITAQLPAYQLAWLVNKYLGFDFLREPNQYVFLENEHKEKIYFPVYYHEIQDSSLRYVIYQLKSAGVSLLPEVKNADYVWMVAGEHPREEAFQLIQRLRIVREIQFVRLLKMETIKTIENLVI